MSIAQFPTTYKERLGRLHGLGLAGVFSYLPISLLNALKVSWVRINTSDINPTAAQLDSLISWYKGNGIEMDFQLPVTPVSGGAFFVPSARAQLICQRWAAAGYRQCFLELGNEVIQLNTTITFTVSGANATAGAHYSDGAGNTYAVLTTLVSGASLVTQELGSTGTPAATGTLTKTSGTGDATIAWTAVSYGFANEALADAGYAACLSSFVSAMAGYDYIVAGLNDEASYVYNMANYLSANGGTWPDLWGHHDYQYGANGGATEPGTQLLLEETTMLSVVTTETNYQSNTITKAQAATLFEANWNNVGTGPSARPWCYFTAVDASYNSSSNAFGLLTNLGPSDSLGITFPNTYSATLTQIASDLALSLP